MSSSNEISIAKVDPFEEMFFTIEIPGLHDVNFAVSEEETWEGTWVYRIYDPTDPNLTERSPKVGPRHKIISKFEFDRIKHNMKMAVEAFNGRDTFYAKIKMNEVVKDFTHHWR